MKELALPRPLRTATPGAAVRAGAADYLVVGGPITAAADSTSAARAIVDELAPAAIA